MADTETKEKEEQKKLEPKSDMSEVGPCRFRIKIEVSADKVRERIDGKYRDLIDSVALPGFRRGHAPRPLLERKFGKDLIEDLRVELLRDSFEEVREARGIDPLGEPDMDLDKIALKEGEPFVYEVTIETRPTFELKEYAGLKVQKPKITLEPKETDAVLEQLRESKAEFVPTAGAAQKDDQVVADFELVLDGKTLDRVENHPLFLNEEIAFYGLVLTDFHAKVEGKKAGDTVEYEVTLNDRYPDKTLNGKKALIRAHLKGIKHKELPAVDEAFAKSFDMDSVAELRAHVEKRLHRDKEAAARAKMADDLVKKLSERHDFPLPEGLVQAGTNEAVERMRLDLTVRGAKDEEIQKVIDRMKTDSRHEIAEALRSHFVLEAIARKEKIFVTEDEIEDRIAEMASQYGKWPHEMKQYLEERGLLGTLRRHMREERVKAFLVEKAAVEE